MSSITNWLYLFKKRCYLYVYSKGLFKEMKDFNYMTNTVMLTCHIVNLDFTRWM